MGLFDFFKKESTPSANVKPLEEYLKQRPLWYTVQLMMKPTITSFGKVSLEFNLHENELRYFSKDFLQKDGEPIPKCYYKNTIKVVTLLKLLLEEKNHAFAALYLALYYEHGIGSGITSEQDTADLYYAQVESLCKEGDTPYRCLKAIEYIKENCFRINHSLTNSKRESLAITIFLYAIQGKGTEGGKKSILEHMDTVRNILGEDDYTWQELRKIGLLLVCNYAQYSHYPYSATMLGNFMQGNVLDKDFGETSETMEKAGTALIRKVICLAENSAAPESKYAHFCLKEFGYTRM